jgi:hypothetical protein
VTTDPLSNPGRRLYEQARNLQRAKRRFLLRKATVVPQPGKVLQFPPTNPLKESDR